MTLRPVSKTWIEGTCSSSGGGGRWMGYRFFAGQSPNLSMVSPRRLKILPSVSLPTGMVIDSSVSTASIPRTNPSVVDIATQRTTFSPRYWDTSTINFVPSGLLIRIALYKAGNSSAKNSTSTTGPMTLRTFPTFNVLPPCPNPPNPPLGKGGEGGFLFFPFG